MRPQPMSSAFSLAALAALLLAVPGALLPAEDTVPTASSSLSPEGQMASLDGRQPVPLIAMMALHQKENMRDHLVVVQEIVQALAAGDFAAVEQAASRIGMTPQSERMCNHMGAGADGFTAMGLSFHRTADSIAEAARSEDVGATIAALGSTLTTCTECHSRFRQEIVSADEWEELTKMRAPSQHMSEH